MPTNDLIIYMATHSEKCSHIDDYIVPIQVGKALNEKQIEEITDDTGNNISSKNGVYCELTALYWIWKNSNNKYVGLYHYRRRFDIDKNVILNILKNKDVILPKKKVFRISLKEQYMREHNKKDWKVLIDTLKEYYPKYYESSKNIFESNEMYRFNMFIMKKELFDKYCEWLFPLIFEVEERTKNIVRDKYQKRYIGFMAERLFTLYILHNKFNVFETDVVFVDSKIKLDNVKNIINNFIFKVRN